MPFVLVGTSGWNYMGWKGDFYPANLPARCFLEFYSAQFPTAEVNYSFYRLPSRETYEKWTEQVPARFIFALKCSRLITHTKRLAGVEEVWGRFIEHALCLEDHLGPVLLQFPEKFQRDDNRLSAFLQIAQEPVKGKRKLRLAFEFRHESWFDKAVYRILEKSGAALCIADSPDYPRRDEVTAHFAYFRYHGRTVLFASEYSREELGKEARQIKKLMGQGLDVYAYFNNDAWGYAPHNARILAELCE